MEFRVEKMTLSAFEDNWDFIIKRSSDACMPVVQDKEELRYVANLLSDCKSYLEVGTAEGNSLYVLAKSMPIGSDITYIDWAEKHTKSNRDFILERLGDYQVEAIHGDSNDYSTFRKVADRKYDMVLIDAGHDDFNVAIDALYYAPLAKKYIVFHDVQLPDVSRVFEWYKKQFDYKSYRVVNSESYGYGVIEL